jgi:hypothetical protein
MGTLDAPKVGGKMVACFGHVEARAATTAHMAVKCPDIDTAAMLNDAGAAERASNARRAPVHPPLATLTADAARHRIAVSYDTVAAILPKTLREAR